MRRGKPVFILFRAKTLVAFSMFLGFLAFAAISTAQDPPATVVVTTKELPKATLWNQYRFQLQATGGIEPYHWRLVSGALPRNLQLNEFGDIIGVVNQSAEVDITVQATDRDGARSQAKKFTLAIEPPLSADWLKKSQVNGTRIDGSVKVSNTTGRDFDLTFVVLAVNDIGRATAIGYQHFPLKKDTRELELPFGDALSPGNYAVNIDLVGEEPVSQMIFRTRLVAPRQTVAQTP